MYTCSQNEPIERLDAFFLLLSNLNSGNWLESYVKDKQLESLDSHLIN